MELNKQYKRKGSVSNNVFIPQKLEIINDENYVIFTNGAKCKLNTFQNEFEEMETNNIINENNDIIDADSFFNPKMSVNDPLLDDVELVLKNPNAKTKNNLSDEYKNSRLVGNNYDTPQPPAHMMQQNNAPVNYDLTNRLNNDNTQQSIQQPMQQVNRLPEHDIFDRVKSKSELEIVVPFLVNIPTSQKIDTMDDMFESSFIEYLAEKYANDIFKNINLLKEHIKLSIEQWVIDDLNSTGRKKKKQSVTTEQISLIKKDETKKNETKKDIKKTKETVPKEKEIKTENIDDLTNKLRSGSNVQENVDINKIFVINTENQYNKVKEAYLKLKEENSTHPDVDRFEDMMTIYEEQINEIKKRNKENNEN